jgi:hypothetical protein
VARCRTGDGQRRDDVRNESAEIAPAPLNSMSKQLSHKPEYQKAKGLAQSAFAFAAEPTVAARILI